MKFKLLLLPFVLLLSFVLQACSSDPKTTNDVQGAVNRCEEPRPEMCTMIYQPVCASLADQSHKTYASGCTACSDKNVQSYVPGACE